MSRNLDGRDSLAGLDNWITREDPQHGEPPVDETTELELVYEQLHALQDAIFQARADREEDADFDGERWIDRSTFTLTFSGRQFDELLGVLGIEAKPGQSDNQAFNEARKA